MSGKPGNKRITRPSIVIIASPPVCSGARVAEAFVVLRSQIEVDSKDPGRDSEEEKTTPLRSARSLVGGADDENTVPAGSRAATANCGTFEDLAA